MVAWPVARTVGPRICDNDDTTLYNWLHDHGDMFATSWNLKSQVQSLNMTIGFATTKFVHGITHFFYIKSVAAIYLQYLYLWACIWSQARCDWGLS